MYTFFFFPLITYEYKQKIRINKKFTFGIKLNVDAFKYMLTAQFPVIIQEKIMLPPTIFTHNIFGIKFQHFFLSYNNLQVFLQNWKSPRENIRKNFHEKL